MKYIRLLSVLWIILVVALAPARAAEKSVADYEAISTANGTSSLLIIQTGSLARVSVTNLFTGRTITNPTFSGTLGGLGTGVGAALGTGTGNAGSVVIYGGALGTPTSGVLTFATGLPVSTGLNGLGTGVVGALATGTGNANSLVLFNGPAGTPSSIALTNTTTIDAKGDVLAGTADNVLARLGVGTNGQVLTADSTQTTGLKWATPSAGTAGGISSILTGKICWVDGINGNDGTVEVGNMAKPSATIQAAINAVVAAGSGTVVILPKTPTTPYNEQITLKRDVHLFAFPGVVNQYTGAGSMFIEDDPEDGIGQIKIMGEGRWLKTGNLNGQHVLKVSGESTHLDVRGQDFKCTVTNTANSAGQTFADDAARGAATPAAIGELGYQTDTDAQYIGTGLAAGAWATLNCSTILKEGGYLITQTVHSIDGVNCPAVRWTNGVGAMGLRLRADRITATGLGCSTLDIGNDDATPDPEQIWVETIELVSDADERVYKGHGQVTNVVFYIKAQTISGCLSDSADHTLLMIDAMLWVPIYDVNSIIPSTTDRDSMVRLGGGGGTSYKIKVMEIECAKPSFIFGAGSYQADVHVQRIPNSGPQFVWESGASAAWVQCDTLYGQVLFTGGTGQFSGYISSGATPSVTLGADGLRLKNCTLETTGGTQPIATQGDPQTFMNLGGVMVNASISGDATVDNGSFGGL